jgi:hypothetical protein
MHTVHTTFHMHTSHESIRDTVARFKELRNEFAGDPDMAFFNVGLNTRRSRRLNSKALKRVHMVQMVAFRNQKSFDHFRENPLHVEIKEKLKHQADWDSADFDLTDAQFEGLKAIPA